jgi:hypothetical protein
VSYNQFADGIHDIGFTDGRIEPTIGFPYDEIDANLGFSDADAEPEDQSKPSSISFQDAAAAWILIAEWITGKNGYTTFALAGARAHSLVYWLSPETCQFASMSEIADEAGCSRAALSKNLLELRDQLRIGFFFKKPEAREAYRECQIKARERGVHSSQRRRSRAKPAQALSTPTKAE